MNAVLRRPGVRALIGTVIGSAPGFLLPFAVAAHFGVGRVTDAYVFGVAIASFGLTLCISTVEQNVLPVAQAYMRAGSASLLRFARRTATQSFLVVGLADVAVAVVGLILLSTRRGWPPWERHLGAVVVIVLILLAAIAGVNSVLAGCLSALNDSLLPTATQSFRSVVPALGLLAIGSGRSAAEVLAWLVVLGELLRTPVLAFQVVRLSRSLEVRGAVKEVLSVWRTAAPAALGILVLAANPIVDRAIAAHYRPGSVTLLDLGEKIFYVPTTVVQASLVLVAGARWAALAHDDGPRLALDFSSTIRRGIVGACVLALATAGALYVVCAALGPTVGTVPTMKVREIVIYFLIGLPGATVALLTGRLLTSTRNTRLLPVVAAQGLIANIVGDLVGGHYLGVGGIALASAVVWTINALVLYVVARRVLARYRLASPDVAATS